MLTAFFLTLFTDAFDAFRNGDEARARELIDFPEFVEIRFDYAQGSIRGSGMGPTFSGIVWKRSETVRTWLSVAFDTSRNFNFSA